MGTLKLDFSWFFDEFHLLEGQCFSLLYQIFFSLVEVNILYISSQVLCHIDRI